MDLITLALLFGAGYLIVKSASSQNVPPPPASTETPVSETAPVAGETVPVIEQHGPIEGPADVIGSVNTPIPPDTYIPPADIVELPTAPGETTPQIAIPASNFDQTGHYDVWIEPYDASAIESGSLPNPFNPEFAKLILSGVYGKDVWLHYVFWVRYWLNKFDPSTFEVYGGPARYWEQVKAILSPVLTPAEIG